MDGSQGHKQEEERVKKEKRANWVAFERNWYQKTSLGGGGAGEQEGRQEKGWRPVPSSHTKQGDYVWEGGAEPTKGQSGALHDVTALFGSNQGERRRKASTTQEVEFLSTIFPCRNKFCPDSAQNDL